MSTNPFDRKLKSGGTAFYIYDKKLNHRDDDSFVRWLKEEGFKLESFGHPNSNNSMYVNISTKVYTWSMGGVALAPIIGNHAIHIDEFKTIYSIFKQYEGLELSVYNTET